MIWEIASVNWKYFIVEVNDLKCSRRTKENIVKYWIAQWVDLLLLLHLISGAYRLPFTFPNIYGSCSIRIFVQPTRAYGNNCFLESNRILWNKKDRNLCYSPIRDEICVWSPRTMIKLIFRTSNQVKVFNLWAKVIFLWLSLPFGSQLPLDANSTLGRNFLSLLL